MLIIRIELILFAVLIPLPSLRSGAGAGEDGKYSAFESNQLKQKNVCCRRRVRLPPEFSTLHPGMGWVGQERTEYIDSCAI